MLILYDNIPQQVQSERWRPGAGRALSKGGGRGDGAGLVENWGHATRVQVEHGPVESRAESTISYDNNIMIIIMLLLYYCKATAGRLEISWPRALLFETIA